MNQRILALVTKDFELQKPALPTYLFSAVFFIVMLLAMDNLSSLAFLLSFQILFNFALVSFAYEEKNNSYRMLLTMPISRADLVTSRYLSVYMVSILLIPIVIGVQFLMAQIILNTSFDTDLTGLIWTNAVYGVSLVLLSLSFLLPMVFRLGTIKANGFVRIVFIAVVLGSVMIGYLLDFLMSLISLETLNQLVAVALALESWIFPLLAIVLASLIFMVSSKFAAVQFLKRDLYADE